MKTMNTMRNRLTACAVTALLAGAATACTSDGGTRTSATARPAATTDACATAGTYTWSGVGQREVLTGVAEKQTFEENGGKLTQPLKRLHTPRTEATTVKGPKIDAGAVLRSLGAHIGGGGEDSVFSEAGRPAPELDEEIHSTSGPGTLVAYTYVRVVTGEFSRACPGGEPSTGRATSWVGDGTGVLECDQPRAALKDSEPALEAALLSCGPDAPAAKG
ncbi:hypothetical protein ACFVU3_20820 [Streptomyces sp. NPDC058052]|uniref:hypothetical protein n=1 Tax=Streptomyces sp. NPDC058052 TaxID=3346316 RepID=UPI0036E6B7C0